MTSSRAAVTRPPDRRRALAELAEQHAALRDRIARCEALADELDADLGDPAQLLREVAALRIALDAHNQYEERVLDPVLLDAGSLGAARVARMVEDHVEEHRALCAELAPTTSADLGRVRQPVLRDAGSPGAARVTRVIDDHVEGHRAPGAAPTASTELRRVLALLVAHLDAEERSLLPSQQRG